MASITMTREKGWADRLRSWNVLIDGERRCVIRNGETIDLEVQPGRRTVSVERGGSKAEPMIDVNDATPSTVQVRPIKLGWFMALLPELWFILNRKRWIELHVPGQAE